MIPYITGNMLDREVRYAAAISGIWLLLVTGIWLLFQSMDLEIIFILWINGLLGIILLIEPPNGQPLYLSYLKMIATGGIIVFLIIIAWNVLPLFN
jgi:hypothetical protein